MQTRQRAPKSKPTNRWQQQTNQKNSTAKAAKLIDCFGISAIACILAYDDDREPTAEKYTSGYFRAYRRKLQRAFLNRVNNQPFMFWTSYRNEESSLIHVLIVDSNEMSADFLREAWPYGTVEILPCKEVSENIKRQIAAAQINCKRSWSSSHNAPCLCAAVQ